MKKVYWFNFFDTESPSVRYRAVYPLSYLESQQKIRAFHLMPDRSLKTVLKTIVLFMRLVMNRKGAVMVVQRVSGHGWYSHALLYMVRLFKGRHKTIYDLDDAIYAEMDNDSMIAKLMRAVDEVHVGSAELMEYARQHNPVVVLVTTAVVPGDVKAVSANGDQLVLGFIGCYWGTHFRNMQRLVFPAFRELPFRVRLEIIGARGMMERTKTLACFTDVPNVEVLFTEIVSWDDETEINNAMMHWDFGLAPLEDTVVCRGKSAFKMKQYLNLGIPCLASPVGENTRFLEDGYNGFFFRDPEALTGILLACHAMTKNKRLTLSENARKSAEGFLLSEVAALLYHRFT